MTNVGFGLVAFVLALGILGASALVYVVAVLGDLVVGVPAYQTAGLLGGLGVIAFLGWAAIETTVIVELAMILVVMVGGLVIIPITVGTVVVYVIRERDVKRALRYGIGSWGPSIVVFVVFLIGFNELASLTPIAYAAAVLSLLVSAGIVALVAHNTTL